VNEEQLRQMLTAAAGDRVSASHAEDLAAVGRRRVHRRTTIAAVAMVTLAALAAPTIVFATGEGRPPGMATTAPNCPPAPPSQPDRPEHLDPSAATAAGGVIRTGVPSSRGGELAVGIYSYEGRLLVRVGVLFGPSVADIEFIDGAIAFLDKGDRAAFRDLGIEVDGAGGGVVRFSYAVGPLTRVDAAVYCGAADLGDEPVAGFARWDTDSDIALVWVQVPAGLRDNGVLLAVSPADHQRELWTPSQPR
jgi:hypothetical protein